jgi:hypothetical protein
LQAKFLAPRLVEGDFRAMTQAHPTADFWSRIQGLRVGGVHELREWIGDDGTHRYFLTNRVEGAGEGDVISVVGGDSQVLEDQLRQWNIATKFDHPHIVRVFSTGYDEIDGHPLVFARMERPEEDLGSVTLGRALTVDETREVARAIVSALQYMHEEGWVHSKIDPWNVVAIGNTIKLIAHEPRPAEPSLVSADIRAFGFTICQLLSRKPDDELISSRALPEPFDAIVRGCTQRGWTLRQVERALEGLPAEQEAPVSHAAHAAPRISTATVPPSEIRTATTRPSSPDRMVWISGAAAAGLLAAILFLAVSRKPATTEPPPPVTQPVTTTVVSTPAPVIPNGTKANAITKAPTPAKAAATTKAAATKEVADWRVIAYTYTARKDAEERVRRIATRWPQMKPEVFAPRSGGAYLVALGGVMTRSEALRLRSTARGSGLPKDTFARNFK